MKRYGIKVHPKTLIGPPGSHVQRRGSIEKPSHSLFSKGGSDGEARMSDVRSTISNGIADRLTAMPTGVSDRIMMLRISVSMTCTSY